MTESKAPEPHDIALNQFAREVALLGLDSLGEMIFIIHQGMEAGKQLRWIDVLSEAKAANSLVLNAAIKVGIIERHSDATLTLTDLGLVCHKMARAHALQSRHPSVGAE